MTETTQRAGMTAAEAIDFLNVWGEDKLREAIRMSDQSNQQTTATCPSCGIPADAGPCGLDPCDMRPKATPPRNQVGLRMDCPIPGSDDNGGPGVPVGGLPQLTITRPVIQPMETAPRDGEAFWGVVGDDALRMMWHPQFNAFVSSWRRMTMAPGYKWVAEDGAEHAQHDHSPVTHQPTGWLPMPEGMK